jgi:hypothetical protein
MGMQDGRCSECGAAEVYCKPGGIVADGAPVRTDAYTKEGLWIATSPTVILTAYICGACGHVALKVEPQELERLHDVFRGGLWTWVEPTDWQDAQAKEP